MLGADFRHVNAGQFRKIIEKSAYFGLPTVLLLAILAFPSVSLFLNFGTGAFLLLTVVTFVKPLSVLLPFRFLKILMTYRREMGVSTFWLYVAHSVGLFSLGAFTPDDIFVFQRNIFWGWLAGMGLTIMALTSNDRSMQLLKRNWKRLHRIVYVLYFLVLYHYSLAENGYGKLIVFGGIFIILKFCEFHQPTRKILQQLLNRVLTKRVSAQH